jgi:4-aminobutyrate aminotransferase-like enzyme
MHQFRTKNLYFNAYGANPVAAAAALATLDVIEHERLVENAHVVGAYSKKKFKKRKKRFKNIGNVRESGPFFWRRVREKPRSERGYGQKGHDRNRRGYL